ncbi:hypothetical protein CRENBAI_004848 [Crenichthys baileyi]|uniref:Movement protein n=1 Tax=Crenichthys baileyi TaxID=28760 RepID=A0AAV9S1C5_9TELE
MLDSLFQDGAGVHGSTDSSGSIEIPSFQTTELMTSGYRTRPSQRTKSLRHSYPLGPTSSWQLPGSTFYAPPRRRTLSTLCRASPVPSRNFGLSSATVKDLPSKTSPQH